jgi:aconitate hydratase
MINGIGVVGWGVGGIEAEAGMLGQPVYLLTPDVVGVHLHGKLGEGVTATDLVLTITEMLRNAKVVGSFVEFFGAGTASLTVPDRATIANMAPEYGATMGFFPVDDATVNYFGITGRTAAEIDAFVSYYKAQDMFGIPKQGQSDYSKVLEPILPASHPAWPDRNVHRIAWSYLRSSAGSPSFSANPSLKTALESPPPSCRCATPARLANRRRERRARVAFRRR